METLTNVKIYCDGACSGNPGPGGWGAILLSGSKRKEISGGEAQTTNNRMELTAALEALKTLNKPCSVSFVTDSSYLLKGASEWLTGWKQRGWRRKEGALLNADLWQALDLELAKHQVSWQWVKGHAGHPLNERADELACQAIPS
jgi:ribonuclease HI